ncbi:MAG: HIT family hydrolase [Chloroflexi bacterium CG07_land_8_20_14_0_80_45_17]|nr:MAG: HIT family hydrolase [Chloroflexi bacterium CG23_combo_of_CG06-09_8_20_14_all_45_10]PIU57004.1 MAG: HIT family hydrolase [Chloroflexi bacterium CG07_land_8_20_14_0_80_45_17]
MEQLWAPWRIQYVTRPKESGCILCQKSKENKDETNFILHRSQNNFIILNAFPYNPGHLMIAPYRHVANLQDLTDDELTDHFNLVKKSLALLKEILNPDGFNIGLNIGKVAGAGIEEHLHTHIVPRWQGDVNFMPVLANTRVISEELAATYKKLKAAIK